MELKLRSWQILVNPIYILIVPDGIETLHRTLILSCWLHFNRTRWNWNSLPIRDSYLGTDFNRTRWNWNLKAGRTRSITIPILIVPDGIETDNFFILKLNTLILIVPDGIETRVCGCSDSENSYFNRTRWNWNFSISLLIYLATYDFNRTRWNWNSFTDWFSNNSTSNFNRTRWNWNMNELSLKNDLYLILIVPDGIETRYYLHLTLSDL